MNSIEDQVRAMAAAGLNRPISAGSLVSGSGNKATRSSGCPDVESALGEVPLGRAAGKPSSAGSSPGSVTSFKRTYW
jgi:hypothetical protein